MLNAEQARAYLEKLGFAEAPQPTKESLDELVYAHQTRIPFSTVALHRAGTAPDLAIDALHDKVIIRGLGGYCFELNKLFQALLESLGFSVRPVLCRAVRGREGRMPINHRGIVVAFDEGRYSADVGFGGPMPSGALHLAAGIEQDINGETYIVERSDHAWWKIDRITKAERDLHDDNLPARRQTEMELCSATVEDIDFAALSGACSQPGTLFRDHEVVNLRTDGGYKGYMDGVLTIRDNGAKTVIEIEGEEAQDAALEEHFGMMLS